MYPEYQSKEVRMFATSVDRQPVAATLVIQGYVALTISWSATCFVISFVVEFGCDSRVPVAQLDRAAAF